MFLMTKSKLLSIIKEGQAAQEIQHNKQLAIQQQKADAQEERSAAIREAIQVTNVNLMLRLQDTVANSDYNPYNTHALQVTEIMGEYSGEQDIGSDLIKRVINISAALKVPNGLALQEAPASPERAYITKFMEINQLNEGVCTELSKEAEKQGQVLCQLIWDPNDKMVKLHYLPWIDYQYTVRPIGLNNMTPPYEIKWQNDANSKITEGTLTNEEVAFVAFNMRFKTDDQLRLVIEGSPTLGNVLQRIDDIGYDLVDWRQTNKLYAHPTPSIQCEDAEEAEALQASITATGWRTGSMMITSGKLTMVVPDNFYQTIKESIQTNLQVVSGATGLSIAWLGFPDLMANRAVSDSLGEPLEIVAANDITSWKSFYEQMFDNVIKIRNTNLAGGTQLKTGVVKPMLRPMSDRIWQQLIRLYLPAAESGVMSRETFWSMIPGFPLSDEKKRFAAELKEKQEHEAEVAVEEQVRKSNPDNRADTGQQSVGSRRFNNERG